MVKLQNFFRLALAWPFTVAAHIVVALAIIVASVALLPLVVASAIRPVCPSSDDAGILQVYLRQVAAKLAGRRSVESPDPVDSRDAGNAQGRPAGGPK